MFLIHGAQLYDCLLFYVIIYLVFVELDDYILCLLF